MNPYQVVRDFEAALAEYTGALYAVTVTSCTDALKLALAWHIEKRNAGLHPDSAGTVPLVEIPHRTYVGVPYAIREAGGRPTFRDEDWWGMYQLKPFPIFDSARWLRRQLINEAFLRLEGAGEPFVCVSFHWSKTLGIQQGGAILHSDPEADDWLRRARFDGRAEGVAPAEDSFPLRRAWHCYMAPETAAAGLVRLRLLADVNEPLPNDDYPDLSTLEAFR